MRVRRVVVLVAVAALAGAGCGGEQQTGAAKARSILTDADRFGTSLDAAQAFLDASDALLAEANECAKGTSKEDPKCAILYSYAGWTRAQTIKFTQCTLPGILESRQIVEERLDELIDGKIPGMPPNPDC